MQFGYNTNFDGNSTFYAGGNNPNGFNPAIAYNTDYGVGYGNAGGPGNNNFFYPSVNYNVPEQNAAAAINQSINDYYVSKDMYRKWLAGNSYAGKMIVNDIWFGEDYFNDIVVANDAIIGKGWNSPIVRAITGDAIYLSAGFNLVYLGGGGADFGIFIPIRGKFRPKVFLTGKCQGLYNISASIEIGKAWYNSPNVANINTKDLDGWGANFEGAYMLGFNWWTSIDEQTGNVTWFGGGMSFGPGIGISGGATYTYTWP